MADVTKISREYKLKLWMERIRNRKKSGKSIAAWCKENGLCDKSYYYWQRKIRQMVMDSLPVETNSAELKPLETRTAFARIPVEPYVEQKEAVTIECNGTILKIHNGASDAVIRNTLRAIKNLC